MIATGPANQGLSVDSEVLMVRSGRQSGAGGSSAFDQEQADHFGTMLANLSDQKASPVLNKNSSDLPAVGNVAKADGSAGLTGTAAELKTLLATLTVPRPTVPADLNSVTAAGLGSTGDTEGTAAALKALLTASTGQRPMVPVDPNAPNVGAFPKASGQFLTSSPAAATATGEVASESSQGSSGLRQIGKSDLLKALSNTRVTLAPKPGVDSCVLPHSASTAALPLAMATMSLPLASPLSGSRLPSRTNDPASAGSAELERAPASGIPDQKDAAADAAQETSGLRSSGKSPASSPLYQNQRPGSAPGAGVDPAVISSTGIAAASASPAAATVQNTSGLDRSLSPSGLLSSGKPASLEGRHKAKSEPDAAADPAASLLVMAAGASPPAVPSLSSSSGLPSSGQLIRSGEDVSLPAGAGRSAQRLRAGSAYETQALSGSSLDGRGKSDSAPAHSDSRSDVVPDATVPSASPATAKADSSGTGDSLADFSSSAASGRSPLTPTTSRRSSPEAASFDVTPSNSANDLPKITAVTQENHLALPPMQQIVNAVSSLAHQGATSATKPPLLPNALTASTAGGKSAAHVLTIQLEPENLGAVVVKMRLSADSLQIHVDAKAAQTANLLFKEKALLSESLRALNYKVGDITVNNTELGKSDPQGNTNAPQTQNHNTAPGTGFASSDSGGAAADKGREQTSRPFQDPSPPEPGSGAPEPRVGGNLTSRSRDLFI